MIRITHVAIAFALIVGLATVALPQERILWRFYMDSEISGHVVAIGPDGTVYCSDDTKLYALRSD